MSGSTRIAARLALLLAAATLPAGAQTLRVRIVDQEAGTPVAGAIVTLLDSAGQRAAESISSPEGRRTFAITFPGTFQVRVRRIGFEPFTSDPVGLSVGETRDLLLRVPGRRIALPPVVVAGSRQCVTRPRDGERLAVIWDEARAALLASELTRESGLVPMTMRTVRRQVDLRLAVLSEVVSPAVPARGRPFASRPAAELSRDGYVRPGANEVSYFAPDERVLLSSEFAADHCFQLAEEAGDPGLVGVKFTPAARRTTADIEGIVWVDSTSAELRHVEFWFVDSRLPNMARGRGRAGGRVAFQRLPDGMWIVSDWHLRMPRTRTERVIGTMRYETRLFGFLEVGGVAAAATEDTFPLVGAEPGRIDGTAYDSLLAAPLAGARVVARRVGEDGTPADSGIDVRTALAGADGRFTFDSLAPGRWLVAAARADLDSAGFASLTADLVVDGGQATALAIATPRPALLARCGRMRDGAGAVAGTVRDASNGGVLVNAAVRVSWWDRSSGERANPGGVPAHTEAWTDSTGAFAACGVPVGQPLWVQAFADGFPSGRLPIAVGARRLALRELTVAIGDAATDSARRGMVEGIVVGESGAPVSGAVVRVDGAPAAALTSRAGRFSIPALRPGTHMVEAVLPGREDTRLTGIAWADIRPDDTARVTLRIAARAPLEQPNIGESGVRNAAALLVEAVGRRDRGLGNFLDAEELATHARIRTAFQSLPGIRVVDAKPYGPGAVLPKREWVAWTLQGTRASASAGAPCTATVFLDGRELAPKDVVRLDIEKVAAIEMYTGRGNVPRRFAYSANACAAVLVWTGGAR